MAVFTELRLLFFCEVCDVHLDLDPRRFSQVLTLSFGRRTSWGDFSTAFSHTSGRKGSGPHRVLAPEEIMLIDARLAIETVRPKD